MAGAPRPASGGPAAAPIRPQTVSRDWTSGRSTIGGGYDPSRMRTADGDVRRGRRRATPRARSSTSGVIPAGHSVRSPGRTSNTSSGWTGWPSAEPTGTRSTGSFGRPAAGAAARCRGRAPGAVPPPLSVTDPGSAGTPGPFPSRRLGHPLGRIAPGTDRPRLPLGAALADVDALRGCRARSRC